MKKDWKGSGGRLGYFLTAALMITAAVLTLYTLRPDRLTQVSAASGDYYATVSANAGYIVLYAAGSDDLTVTATNAVIEQIPVQTDDGEFIYHGITMSAGGVITIADSQPIVGFMPMEGHELITAIDASEAGLYGIDVTNCTALKTLNLADTNIEELDLTGCNALEQLDISNTDIESLDLRYGWAMFHPLRSINVTNCGALETLSLQRTKLRSLDLTGCTSLGTLDMSGSVISSVDLSEISGSLQSLTLTGTNIETIDLSDCFSLEKLYLNDTMLQSIDLSDCVGLTNLDLSSTRIRSIDLSELSSLQSLNLRYTAITEIDFSGLTELTNPIIAHTSIRSFDKIKGLEDIQYNTPFTVDIEEPTMTKIGSTSFKFSEFETHPMFCYANDNTSQAIEAVESGGKYAFNYSDFSEIFANSSDNAFRGEFFITDPSYPGLCFRFVMPIQDPNSSSTNTGTSSNTTSSAATESISVASNSTGYIASASIVKGKTTFKLNDTAIEAANLEIIATPPVDNDTTELLSNIADNFPAFKTNKFDSDNSANVKTYEMHLQSKDGTSGVVTMTGSVTVVLKYPSGISGSDNYGFAVYHLKNDGKFDTNIASTAKKITSGVQFSTSSFSKFAMAWAKGVELDTTTKLAATTDTNPTGNISNINSNTGTTTNSPNTGDEAVMLLFALFLTVLGATSLSTMILKFKTKAVRSSHDRN